jgi:hypothetical protein
MLPGIDTVPLIPKSATSENEKKNGLIAFVGEKIDVQPLPQEPGSMDGSFSAKYKVLLRVYGHYAKDTIEFVAYDHYGWPAFSRFQNVLLFVREYEGKYYHEKYQYFDVYKTKNGRWASPYQSEEYGHPYNKYTTIEPEPIQFAERVAYPLHWRLPDGTEDSTTYPSPYFESTGDSAIAIYGNYLEDLFALKRSGVLRARGLFETTPEQEESMVQDEYLDEAYIPNNVDNLKFRRFWKKFAAAAKAPGLKSFTRTALDSLWICDTLIATRNFINNCYQEVLDSEVIRRMNDGKQTRYTWIEAGFETLPSNAKNEIVRFEGKYRLREALVSRSDKNNYPHEMVFDFIETKKGYRLYGIDRHRFKGCCR